MVVGGGGREHALAWALGRSRHVDRVYVAPGNGGTAGVGKNVDVAATDVDELAAFAADRAIDLTVVGPEAPLMAGITDRFRRDGLRCFGPTAGAARLEGSKVFAKEFMARYAIPSADFQVFDDAEAARSHVLERETPMVIKADGLAAGKGVYVTATNEEAAAAVDEIMVDGKFGGAGARVVVEDCLEGEEVSVHAICAGGRALLLPSSQDHKRVFDGDQGPNTGGMGAYAPVPSFSDEDRDEVYQSVIIRVLEGMEEEGTPFHGVLYAGLMCTASGPKVLEFNVRFGDPETQVLLPLVKSDLFEVLSAAAGGELPDSLELWKKRSAATVVVAAQGYPGDYARGGAISGIDGITADNVMVFQAGTQLDNSRLVTSGGRVLAVTAWESSLRAAIESAYAGVDQIHFDGAYWRRDIGHRAL